jgi:two-component system CheB/CheR fusion protein
LGVDPQEASPRADEGERPLIVGIGASAGGLEAFERFLRSLPSDSGLACVLVQHLDPEHESLLPEILSRATLLPVAVAQDGQRIERDHVYVIPRGTGLVVEDGALHLRPADHRGVRLLANTFLTSLAEDQRENAVGIVLSGTGSDGALGICSIRAHGGRTFAQLPADARYASMPAAAIATGMVDQVLPAADLPAALVALAAERRKHPPESAQGEADGLRRALEAVARTTGHDFSRYKRSTILRRLHRRMLASAAGTLRDYAALLESSADEVHRLAEDLTISVTSFFRDDEPFRAVDRILRSEGFGVGATDGVRVWVPGCASGEEAYSLAMLLCERGDELPRPPKFKVFASDIDVPALAEARRGQYPGVVAEQVPPERLARFFTKRGDTYTVTKSLRDVCLFTEHDLIRDPPFSRMDLVSCRNLLIYLEPALQRHVIELFHYALRPGGHLLLGKAEMVDSRDLELFEVVDPTSRVFRRRDVSRRPPPVLARSLTTEQAPARSPRLPEARSAAERSRDVVLEEFAPPSVVVDARGEIRYYWGARLSLVLPVRAGAPLSNLLHLAPRALRGDLSAALHNAARHGKLVRCEGLTLEVEGAPRRLDVVIRPLAPVEGDPDALFLVVFEVTVAVQAPGAPLDAPTLERHLQLQRDLESTQERLQVTVDDLEDANEALRASNEQLQAMNEEMNSSNEELQTSQEELQSVNEELNTLNTELSRKVDELELLYGDLQNLFQSTQIATIFLDRDARIARFTPAATTLFHLVDGDVGRPLGDFAARFDVEDLSGEIRRVLEKLESVERTVRLVGAERWFLLRVNPYRTPSNVIAGVVVSFIEVTRLKETEAALQRAVAELEEAERSLRDVDERRTEFLGVLSHELRNPLAPIRNALLLLQRAAPGSAQAARALAVAERQTDQLARLVDDLLDATRISRGKLQVQRRPVELSALLRQALEDHRPAFAARAVALEGQLDGRPRWVDGDAARLTQVVGNVLQNAAKFTGPQGRVTVSLADGSDGRVAIRVVDDGEGIAPELLDRVFEPFVQAETTLHRTQGGLGLGLALVKAVAELHGGRVEAHSDGTGHGAAFSVWLPLLDEARIPSAAATRPARPPPAAPLRILVIEDNLDGAETLREVLELSGHAVTLAHDGQDGLAKVRSLKPDAVLCDLGLPGLSGFEVAQRIRADPTLSPALIALTGYTRPEDQREALRAGFDHHLGKPIRIEELEEVLASLTSRPGSQEARDA